MHQGEREARCTVHVHVYQNLPNVHTCMWECLSDRKKGIKREGWREGMWEACMYIRKGGRDEGTEGGREGGRGRGREGGREGERDRERVCEAGSPGRDGGSVYV